jgi:hypothetical protein
MYESKSGAKDATGDSDAAMVDSPLKVTADTVIDAAGCGGMTITTTTTTTTVTVTKVLRASCS